LYQLVLFPAEPVQVGPAAPEKSYEDRGVSVLSHQTIPTVGSRQVLLPLGPFLPHL
jgi:hypothetical protein